MTRHITAALVFVVLAVSGCAAAAEEPALLPPFERDDIAALFDPLVGPLGYEVTRASLIDRSTYEVDPAGGHLAIYVAPTSDISADRFAEDFVGLVQVFLPFVFAQWPELNSFDVCQEPFNSTDTTPPSLTIIDLTREAAAGVTWDALDLSGIIDLNERAGISVFARRQVRETATWRDAAGV